MNALAVHTARPTALRQSPPGPEPVGPGRASWRRRGRAGTAAALALWALLASGCGKKGPPLPPPSRIPAPVDQLTARRLGREVYLSLVVPTTTIDGSPGTARRIDVYGYTGSTAPPRGRFVERASLVGSVPVAPVVEPNGLPPRAPVEGAVPGTTVHLLDRLTAEQRGDRLPPSSGSAGNVGVRPASAGGGALRRFYMALAFNERGVPGPAGRVVELPLSPLPDPPARVDLEQEPSGIRLSWTPSGGLIGFLADRQMPLEAPPFDVGRGRRDSAPAEEAPAGPMRYNVYREIAPDPLVLSRSSAAPADPAPPAPINAAPLETLVYTDAIDADERERCYTVRAVRGTGSDAAESEPSALACIRPVDRFPPAQPQGLSAIPGEGTITLIWEANAEPDLAGYLVLRGRPGDATLLPLTDTPIRDTRYTDRTAVPGVRYVYAVVALDARVPVPNTSAPSETVEELAR